jgi:colanic acid biosynthesis glycosyl transferase WcaI
MTGRRLLILALNAPPEPVGAGRATGLLATGLAGRGHAVTLVAAPPHFPDWRVPAAARARWWRWDRVDGLAILRCPTWVPARPTGLGRLLQQASFAASSLPALVWQLACRRPDAVLVVAPALTAAPGAWLAARLAGVPLWLHVQDLELDAALGLGLLPTRLARPLAVLERRVLRRFDRVTTISAAMGRRLQAKGVPADRLGLVPNGIELDRVPALPPDSAARATARSAFGFPADGVVALYAGSLGRKQGAELLLETARRLADRGDLRLVVVTAGPAAFTLRTAAADLPGLMVRDLVPAERLGALLASADLHVLPQEPAAADLVLPSRLAGMLASGRPVVAAAPPGSALAHAIDGCGVALPENAPAAFAAALRRLADDPVQRRRMGVAARARAQRDHDLQATLDAAEATLLGLTPRQAERMRAPSGLRRGKRAR